MRTIAAISRRPVPLDSPVSFRRVPRLTLFLFASVMLFASPQALSDTFVKNNSKPTNSFREFTNDLAQGFTTGDNAAGYTMTRATIYVNHAAGVNPDPRFHRGRLVGIFGKTE